MHVARVRRVHEGRDTSRSCSASRTGRAARSSTGRSQSHRPAPRGRRRDRAAPAGRAPGAGREAFRIRRSLPHGHVAAVLGMLRTLGSRGRSSTAARRACATSRPPSSSPGSWRPPRSSPRLGPARARPRSARSSRPGGRDGGRAVRRDGLAAGPPGPGRAGARAAPSRLGLARPVRRHARRTWRAATARSRPIGYSRDHRPDRPQIVFGLRDRRAGLPGRGRGLHWQHGRPGHPRDPDRQAPDALRAHRHRPRRRPGDAHHRPHRAAPGARRDRLGELPAGTGHPPARRGGRPPALPVRRAQPRRDHAPRSSPASGSSSAATRPSPPSGPASARRCWPRPRRPSRRSRPLVERGTAADAPPRSACAPAGSWTRQKMAKHFELDIAEGHFAYRRRADAIAAEAALDGLYVVRTSVGPERLDAPAVVETYKRLAAVERDFRAAEGRRARASGRSSTGARTGSGPPVPVPPRGLCPLAPRGRLGAAPVPRRGATGADRSGRSARTARRAPCARTATTARPTACRSTASGRSWPSSPRSTRNRVVPAGAGDEAAFEVLAEPTPLQARAFELIGVSPGGCRQTAAAPRPDLNPNPLVFQWKFGLDSATPAREDAPASE